MKLCKMKATEVSRSVSYKLGWKAAAVGSIQSQPFLANDLRKCAWLAGYNDYKITTGE